MDRFAFFVDAGYVYAAGGLLCHNTKKRTALDLNFATFNEALVHLGEVTSHAQHLRSYWYDGALHGIPTLSHQTVGRLKGVKLRLGQISGQGQQKGVDSLVVRDLIKLSSEHAISWAFLLSGDEDLRQGMIEAQDHGVRVALVGIEPCSGNQSETLLREADDHIALDVAFMGSHLAISIAVQATLPTTVIPPATPPDPFALGQQVAVGWIENATPAEVLMLASARRRNSSTQLPSDNDRELLARGRIAYGTIVPTDKRHEMRNGFWSAILSYTPPELGSADVSSEAPSTEPPGS